MREVKFWSQFSLDRHYRPKFAATAASCHALHIVMTAHSLIAFLIAICSSMTSLWLFWGPSRIRTAARTYWRFYDLFIASSLFHNSLFVARVNADLLVEHEGLVNDLVSGIVSSLVNGLVVEHEGVINGLVSSLVSSLAVEGELVFELGAFTFHLRIMTLRLRCRALTG